MKLTGVIFDLDGTIAESHPMAFQLIGGAIADHGGGSLTPEDVMALFGPNEQGIFQRALGDRWEPAWAQYVEDYERHHDICPEPFPGVRGLLERLRACGTRLGLVTGKTETTARISLEVFGITELFDGVHGGSVNGSVKEAAIADLLEAWRLDRTEVAYVGDHPGDVVEARGAGVVAVAAVWSAFADRNLMAAEEPDAIFDDVDEFAGWVESRACS